ncbi:hypothetical protein BU17DRAFT_99473 [Hysterangium stoloniferum]|nr:hypothetical protein BU17DRAFT_99473 [Hysterangium stoloniferum]
MAFFSLIGHPGAKAESPPSAPDYNPIDPSRKAHPPISRSSQVSSFSLRHPPLPPSLSEYSLISSIPLVPSPHLVHIIPSAIAIAPPPSPPHQPASRPPSSSSNTPGKTLPSARTRTLSNPAAGRSAAKVHRSASVMLDPDPVRFGPGFELAPSLASSSLIEYHPFPRRVLGSDHDDDLGLQCLQRGTGDLDAFRTASSGRRERG